MGNRYASIKVKDHVYVSSNGDYFVEVMFKERGIAKKFTYIFHLNRGLLVENRNEQYKEMPRYFVGEVLTQLKMKSVAGQLRLEDFSETEDIDFYKKQHYYDRFIDVLNDAIEDFKYFSYP